MALPHQISQLYIFDIDGVLTNPTTKKNDNPALFAKLNQLAGQMPILLNTGRSAEWVIKKIIPHLNLAQLQHSFFATCEMGAVSLSLSSDGNPKIVVNPEVSSKKIPPQLYATITDMVKQNYSASMFVDTTKQVIMTVEMRDNYALAKYDLDKEELKNSIDIILKHYHPGIHIRPSSSTIAIDIKPIQLTKGYGAKVIHQWLSKLQLDFTKIEVVCLGDSSSDAEMSDYFVAQKIATKFVYVGTNNFDLAKKYPVITTKQPHTSGTLEYLTQNY